jgi:hypothetical protein
LSRSAQRLNALARASRIAFEQARKSHQVVLKIDLDPQGMF